MTIVLILYYDALEFGPTGCHTYSTKYIFCSRTALLGDPPPSQMRVEQL